MPKNILPNAQHLPKSAKLILQDKTIFSGFSFGFPTSASGEVVFNTGMMGYPESLTDPSYRGQILMFTYPSLGNYGVPKQKRNKYNILTNFESEKITDGYMLRRTAADYHVPLITNKQLAKQIVEAMSEYKEEELQVKSWDEYTST